MQNEIENYRGVLGPLFDVKNIYKSVFWEYEKPFTILIKYSIRNVWSVLNTLLNWPETLHKTWDNTGFHWPVFCHIRTESMILSLSWRIWVVNWKRLFLHILCRQWIICHCFGKSPSGGRELEILPGDFFYWVVETWGGVILTIPTFFKSKHSFLWMLNIKSKLVWPVCPKSMKLRQKWYRSNEYSWRWRFYWVITWKLLFSWGEFTFVGRRGIIIWWGGTLPSLQ